MEVCLAKNDLTALQIQSGDMIRVNSGCYIRTMDHVISADKSEMIEVRMTGLESSPICSGTETTRLSTEESKDSK
jgi:hypothetical protein